LRRYLSATDRESKRAQSAPWNDPSPRFTTDSSERTGLPRLGATVRAGLRRPSPGGQRPPAEWGPGCQRQLRVEQQQGFEPGSSGRDRALRRGLEDRASPRVYAGRPRGPPRSLTERNGSWRTVSGRFVAARRIPPRLGSEVPPPGWTAPEPSRDRLTGVPKSASPRLWATPVLPNGPTGWVPWALRSAVSDLDLTTDDLARGVSWKRLGGDAPARRHLEVGE
jgi:hypothetical protein